MAEYFLDIDGQTVGPYTLNEVLNLHRKGVITDQTIFTTPESSQWFPVAYLPTGLSQDTPKTIFNGVSTWRKKLPLVGICTVIICIFAGANMLVSDRRSAARQEAIQEFKTHIAEITIATETKSCDSIQKASDALKISWEANRALLPQHYFGVVQHIRKLTRFTCDEEGPDSSSWNRLTNDLSSVTMFDRKIKDEGGDNALNAAADVKRRNEIIEGAMSSMESIDDSETDQGHEARRRSVMNFMEERREMLAGIQQLSDQLPVIGEEGRVLAQQDALRSQQRYLTESQKEFDERFGSPEIIAAEWRILSWECEKVLQEK